MFGLLHNLYKYIKKKSERSLCLVVLGIDNAGKTTLLNTVQGELEKETAPTFGFSSTTTNTRTVGIGGRNTTLQVFDLGGGKNIRRVWKSYLAEVHGVIYVVDAADAARFEECRQVLQQTLEDPHLRDKPVLVFANKQDLPTAATGADVATQLGLSSMQHNRFQILPCTAKTPAGQQPDPRLRDGLKWMVGAVDSVFSKLDERVRTETEVVRAEEARKKKEREERARAQKEERARQQREAEEAAAAAAAAGPAQHNALSGIPGAIESPKPERAALPGALGHSSSGAPAIHMAAPKEFSDLQSRGMDQASHSPVQPVPYRQPAAQVASLHVGPPPITTVAELPPSPGLPPDLPSAMPTNLPLPMDNGSDGHPAAGKGSFRMTSRVVPEPDHG